MLASAITFLVALGMLVVFACNGLLTGFFLRRPPRGEGARALVVPLIAFLVGGTLVVLAGLLASLRSGRAVAEVLGASTFAAGAATAIVTLGVVVAAFIAFVAWMEPIAVPAWARTIRVSIGWSLGLVAPAVLAATLIADAWLGPQWFASTPKAAVALRAACWALPVVALLGFAAGAYAFWQPIRTIAARKHASLARALSERHALREALRDKSLVQLFAEELDRLSPDAEVEEYLGYYVFADGKLDRDCRALLASRILARPDLERQLVRAMRSKPYTNRRGAAQFMLAAPPEVFAEHRASWALAVAAGIGETGDDMSCRPSWLRERFDGNDEPLGLVKELLTLARRFEGTPDHAAIRDAIRTMASDADALTRDKEWTRLAKELERAGFPIPTVEGAGQA
jgi:hypothetical protein